MDLQINVDPNSASYRDLEISADGDLLLVDGKAAILQDILGELGFYLGEWYLDVTLGIDYYGQILTKRPDQSKIDAIFINKIVGVPGVTQLNTYDFTSDFLSRTLTTRFQASTTFGTVDYTGTVNSQ